MTDLSKASNDELMRPTYNSLRKAGLSHQGALVMAGEIGRENGYRKDLIFGTHSDPANQATNTGLISWQGPRKTALEKQLTDKGLMKDGKMQQSEATLDAQAEFLVGEMKSQNKQLFSYLSGDKVDPQKGMDMVGRDFIRWRIDDPKYHDNGIKNRNYYYSKASALVNEGDYASAASGGVPPLPGQEQNPGGVPTSLPPPTEIHPGAIPDFDVQTPQVPIGKTNQLAENLMGPIDFDSHLSKIQTVDPNFIAEQGGLIDGYRQRYKEVLEQNKKTADMLANNYKIANDAIKAMPDLNITKPLPDYDFTQADIANNNAHRQRIDDTKGWFMNVIDNIHPENNYEKLREAIGRGAGAGRAQLESNLRDYLTRQSENSWYGKLGAIVPEYQRAAQQSFITAAWSLNGTGELKLFAPDKDFNAYDYITEQQNKKRDLGLQHFDEESLNRVMNSRSKAEFDHEYGLGLQKQDDVKTYGQSSLGNLGGEISKFGTDPLSLVATAVTGGAAEAAVGAAAAKAAITGWKLTAATAATGVTADALSYAGLQVASGAEYTSHDVFMDMVMGGAFSAAGRGIGKGIKAARTATKAAEQAEREVKVLNKSVEQQVRNEMPDATNSEVRAETQRRLNDINAVDNSPSAMNLSSSDRSSWSAEDTAKYNKVMREHNLNKENIAKNAERAQARKAKETTEKMQRADEELAQRNEELRKATPGYSQIVEKADGTFDIDPSLQSKLTPPQVAENVRRAVNEVNTEFTAKPHTQQAAEALRTMRGMDETAPRSIAKPTEHRFKSEPVNSGIKEKTGAQSLRIKWSEAWQDVAYRSSFTAKKVSKGAAKALKESAEKATKKVGTVADEVVDKITHDRDLMTALNTEMRKRIDEFPEKLTKENAGEFGKVTKSRNGNSRFDVDFDKIWSKKDVEKFVFDYYKNKPEVKVTPEVRKTKLEALREKLKNNVVDGEQVRIAMKRPEKPSVAEKAKDTTPEYLKDLDESKDFKEETLSEIYKRNGISEKYHFEDPEKAFQAQILENKAIKQAAKVESTKTAQRIKVHTERMNKFAKTFAGAEKLIAPVVDLMGSTSSVVRRLAYAFENPIGATINRTAPMVKMQVFNKMMNGVEAAYSTARRSFVENFTNKNRLGDLLGIDAKNQFEDAFYKYYNTPVANRASNPHHEIFQDYAKKVADLFDMDRELRKRYNLEGADLLGDTRNDMYLPSRIDTKKLQSLSPEARDAYMKTLAKSIAENEPSITPYEAEKISMSILERASAIRAQGGNVTGSLHGNSAWRFVEEALNDKNIKISDAERVMLIDKVSRSMENMRKSKAKRNVFDVVETPDGNFTLGDVMVKDVLSMARQRAQETSGWVGLRDNLGFRNTQDIEMFKLVMQKNGATAANIENANMMFAEMLGQNFGNKQPGSGGRVFMSIARTLMLQKSGFAQVMEYGNVILSLGVVDGFKVVAKSFGMANEAKKLARTGKTKNHLMKTVYKEGFSHVDEIYNPLSFINVDRFVEEVPVMTPSEVSKMAKLAAGTELTANRLEDLTNRMSGMKYFLAGQTAATMDTVIKRAYTKFKAGKLSEDIDLVNAGFSPEVMQKMEQSGAFVTNERGKLVDINTNYAGKASEEFLISARRFTDQTIQATHIGERGRWFHEGSWRLAMMMRSYTIAGLFKQTGRRLSMYGPMKTLFHTLGWATFNAPIYASRVMFTAMMMADEEKSEKYLENNLAGYKMFTGGLSYTGTTSIGGDITNLLMAVANPDMSNYKLGGSGAVTQMFPALGPPTMVLNAVDAVASNTRAVVAGEEPKADASGKVGKLVPLANTPPGQLLMYSLNQFSDAIDHD